MGHFQSSKNARERNLYVELSPDTPATRKLKRMQDGDRGPGENWVEQLEQQTRPQEMSAAVSVHTDRVVLYVDSLYWGIRRMISKLLYNHARMTDAQRWLNRQG